MKLQIGLSPIACEVDARGWAGHPPVDTAGHQGFSGKPIAQPRPGGLPPVDTAGHQQFSGKPIAQPRPARQPNQANMQPVASSPCSNMVFLGKKQLMTKRDGWRVCRRFQRLFFETSRRVRAPAARQGPAPARGPRRKARGSSNRRTDPRRITPSRRGAPDKRVWLWFPTLVPKSRVAVRAFKALLLSSQDGLY